MTVGDLVASGIGLLGLIGGTIGFFTAWSARKKADASAAVAEAARLRSTDALERSASAGERLTALWERVMTPSGPEVRFEPHPEYGMHAMLLINKGDAKAFAATVHGYPAHLVNMVQSGDPQDVPPNGAIDFDVDESSGVEQVEVAWQNAEHSEIFRKQFWIT